MASCPPPTPGATAVHLRQKGKSPLSTLAVDAEKGRGTNQEIHRGLRHTVRRAPGVPEG